jgi:hypothetical protein
MKTRQASVVGSELGVPTGIRTPVAAVRGRCPRPLDDGDPGREARSFGCPRDRAVFLK